MPQFQGKGRYWYIEPVSPRIPDCWGLLVLGCAFQVLPRTTIVPAQEAAISCAPPMETGVLEEAEEDLAPVKVEPGSFELWVYKVWMP